MMAISMRPNIPQQQASKCVLLKNMFSPEESVVAIIYINLL